MLYFISLSILIPLLLVATAIGRRFADFLPDTLKEEIVFYIAPLLGLASLVLITTVYGWLSPFKTSISIALSVGLLLLGIVFEKQRADLFRDWLIVSAFAIVATIPILAPAIRFDSFNPFNDTFTYLVHGQWLQEHAFSEGARSSGFFPAETQVLAYQVGGHRMGASFFLGFVQSLFHIEWSYYAYLPTVAFVFTVGCLAIGGIIRQVIAVSKTACIVLCTLPAFSMNGYVLGAQLGFFPQTYGLAFVSGLVCLLPIQIDYTLISKPIWEKQFFYLLPLTLLSSALLFSYSDISPALGAGIGLFLILAGSLYWKDRYRIIGFILMLAVQVLAVINISGFRILRNLVYSAFGAASGAVQFGWQVKWSPLQFLAHSFGMKAPFPHDLLWGDKLISGWIFLFLLGLIVVIMVKVFRTKPRNLTVLLIICTNMVFWLAFAKFRYATRGLEGEAGYTFLQFKLSKWLSPFNLGLLGISLAWVSLKTVRYRSVLKCIFLTVFVIGMYFQYMFVSQAFTEHFQNETMRKYSPFNVFIELRSRVANISKDQVIYVGVPADNHKLTQMVAYVLSDRKLASDYVDGYIRGAIPAHERNMPPENSDWMIQLKREPTLDENPLNRVGPFFILHAPFSFFSFESITGAYATETEGKKTRNWVKDFVEYRFRSIGKTQHSKVKFQFLLAGNPRTLFLELNSYSGKRIASFEIPMRGGWGNYESPPVETNSENIAIHLKADGNPVRLAANDPREAKFLIQNLAIESD